MAEKKIRVVAFVGSVRPGNFTSKALNLVVDELERDGDVSVRVVDPTTLTLPPPNAVNLR